MTPTRREFVRTSAAAGAAGVALGLGGALGACAGDGAPDPQGTDRAQRTLRILVLGGTGFIGPHLVRYARERGHVVTLFNRGRTNPELFGDLETLIGDRNDDLTALEGREWDVVFDTPTTFPHWARQSAAVLRDQVPQYVFVSTISVYADTSQIGMDETTPVLTTDDPDTDEITGESYGPLKALAEEEVRRAYPESALIVRPGLIVGPGDPTDRWTYWPVRVDRGGEILAPGDGTDDMQFIDARDMTAWMVRAAESGVTGTFNATGPSEPMPIGECLSQLQTIASNPGELVWADAEWLAEQGVAPWRDMPVWFPPSPEMAGFLRVSIDRALAAGLTFRPMLETARDTLEWHGTRSEEERNNLQFGLSPEREAELIAAWKARAV